MSELLFFVCNEAKYYLGKVKTKLQFCLGYFFGGDPMEVCRGIAMCFGSSYFLLAGFFSLPPPFYLRYSFRGQGRVTFLQTLAVWHLQLNRFNHRVYF